MNCAWWVRKRFDTAPGKRGRTDDLEGVGDNADGHQLLSVVAAVHHEGVGKALNDGAVGLAEALDGIAAGRVRQVDGGTDLDVVAAGQSRLLASALTCGMIVCGGGASRGGDVVSQSVLMATQ